MLRTHALRRDHLHQFFHRHVLIQHGGVDQAGGDAVDGDLAFAQLDGQRFGGTDEVRLQALPEAVVLELHRDGLLKALHLQLASLATMRHLIERKARRERSRRGAGDGPQ